MFLIGSSSTGSGGDEIHVAKPFLVLSSELRMSFGKPYISKHGAAIPTGACMMLSISVSSSRDAIDATDATDTIDEMDEIEELLRIGFGMWGANGAWCNACKFESLLAFLIHEDE